MSSLYKVVLLIVSQVCFAANLSIGEQLENISNLDLDKILNLNKNIFSSLQGEQFGSFGSLLYEIMTNENALGVEFAKISKSILEYINLEQYKQSFDAILTQVQQNNIGDRLEQLVNRVGNLQLGNTDKSGIQVTLGDVVAVIKEILENPANKQELHSIIVNGINDN